MTSELRPAVAAWSDPSPPNDFCPYDHCSAKALFGTMRIEWKSWKDYPGYCLYFDAGETFIGSFDSLDRAKEHAAAVIEADREAVRAEQAAEIERLKLRLAECSAAGSTMRQTIEELHAEREKFKALAETLAGALDRIANQDLPTHRENGERWWFNGGEGFAEWATAFASEALRQYKEARDAS